jgi:ERF superfamily
MSTRSDSIKEIGTALAKAQAVLTGAVKDSINPHFRNKYADLASCWDACRKALTSNGIAVVQMPEKDMIGYYVETLLTHSSGEWIASKCYIHLQKDDPQGLGSAITYARRYGLSAMVGICPEDDDAELAQRTAAATAAARGPVPVIPRPAPVAARVANPVTGLKKPEPIEHQEERDENDDFVF